MPNSNSPKGLIPVKHIDSSPWNGASREYLFAAADGTAAGVGDVVVITAATGAAGAVVTGVSVEGMPIVTRMTTGTAGATAMGVIVGFVPDPTNLNVKHRLASTARVALVVDDPTVIFEVQEDAVTTPIAAASVGRNAAITVGSVNATTGVSGMQLTSASAATTATLPLRIMRLVGRPDNHFNTAGAGSDNAKFEVRFNTHYNLATTSL